MISFRLPRPWRVAVLIGLLGAAGWAHQPLWNAGSPSLESAWTIEAPTVSKAVFGALEPGERAWFELDAPGGFTLDARVFAGGACDASFRPRLWRVSPGDGSASAAPFALPEGFVATEAAGAWEPYRGHGLDGWGGPALRAPVETGTHYLVVRAPPTGGVYLLSLGGSERFGGTAEGRAGIGRFNRCDAP